VNVFRNEYRTLNPDESKAVLVIKEVAAVLYDNLGVGDKVPVKTPDGEVRTVQADPRMLALARTKLEESVMWATKAITG
jgi:hypothetical protein